MTDECHSDRILDSHSWLERMSQKASTRPRRTLLNPSPAARDRGFPFSVRTRSRGTGDCLLWHKADMPVVSLNVRFWGQTGKTYALSEPYRLDRKSVV